MPVSLFAVTLLALLALPANGDVLTKELYAENGPVRPMLPPDASVPDISDAVATDIAEDIAALQQPAPSHPTQVVIPAIGVNSYIVNVGVNAAGEMDVPDGATQNVGWYKYGTVPGAEGSAVLDAHVYAAFKKLKSVAVGNRIYIADAEGTMREFKVISSKVYPLANVPMETIFTDSSGKYLNLITCEGRYSVAKGTYSHRRVVFAELVE
jgi:sortase (surface protein transpeptidase)